MTNNTNIIGKSVVGVQKMDRLVELVVQRSYSKNNDIKLLENNGYSEDCATSYMDGYIDGLSYILSMVYPNIDFEAYINLMINNELNDLSLVKIGTILASKKVPDYTNNLSLVISCTETNEGINLTVVPILCETDVKTFKWERKYNIDIEGLPNIYPNTGFAIDLGTMYPMNINKNNTNMIKDTLSIIHTISEEQVAEIIKAYEDYDKEMGALYDAAIQKNS